MSSTRRAKDDSVFHQSRFASSPEFEMGLSAFLVNKRCSVLDNAADRELVWLVQYLSLQPGGLAALAADLVEKYPGQFGTCTMVALGKKPGDRFTADEVRLIRKELPSELADEFLLFGEVDRFTSENLRGYERNLLESKMLRSFEDETLADKLHYEDQDRKFSARKTTAETEAKKHPQTYPMDALLGVCNEAAFGRPHERDRKPSELEKSLAKLCLDPAYDLDSGPWYFFGLIEALREYQKDWAQKKSQLVITAVVTKIRETLEFTRGGGILSLLTGPSNLGARFAARAWCEQHAGSARLVDVPPSNSEAEFFRAIARALGLANFLSQKNVQIRERVEAVLQAGDILLVINSAQNLWPLKNLRESFPGRLAWVLDQVEHGALICLISGPQFFMQKRPCEKTGWNSPELQGRIQSFGELPDSLTVEDLTAIAQVVMPDANEAVWERVGIYGLGSERYLAAIETINKRAQFIAQRAGRPRCVQDFWVALEFVNTSDASLRSQLAGYGKSPSRPRVMPSTPRPPMAAAPPARGSVSEKLDQPVARRGINEPVMNLSED